MLVILLAMSVFCITNFKIFCVSYDLKDKYLNFFFYFSQNQMKGILYIYVYICQGVLICASMTEVFINAW